MRATAVLAVGLAVALAAGCGQTVASAGAHQDGNRPLTVQPAATPAYAPHDVCGDWSGRLGKPPKHPHWQREKVPAGFDPVLLISCEEQERTTPHDGEWTVLAEEHATSGLAAIVAALRSTPPPPPPGEIACASDLPIDPWFLLVDRSGRVVLPVIPHDRACDKPIYLPLDKLHFTTVSTKRLRQQATAAELATGCTDSWKNEPRMMANDGYSRPATSSVTVASTPIDVCTYRSSSTDPEVGDFAGGVQLSAADATRIGRLMHADAPSAGAVCAPAGDYAVVHTNDGSWTYVSLSGCEAMYVDEGQTWTAPVPDLVRAIKALHLQR